MLLTQIGQLLTMEPKNARAGSEARVGLIEDAVVVTHGQDLAWVGARADLPAEHAVAGHEVVDCGDSWIECMKTFTGDEPFFAGHYPNFPLVPGVLLCEAAMQCGTILVSKHFDGAEEVMPVATGMNNVRFKRMVRPGDTINIRVELVERLDDTFFLKARITLDDRVAARLEFACTIIRATQPLPTQPR